MSDCWVHTVIDFIQRHWRHWCVPKIGCKMKLKVTKLIVQLVIKLNLYYIFFVLMIWWGLFCFVCFFSYVRSSSKLEGGTIQTILDDYDDRGEESDDTEPLEWNSFSCLWVWLLIWCCSQCGNSGKFYNMFIVWDVWWFVVFLIIPWISVGWRDLNDDLWAISCNTKNTESEGTGGDRPKVLRWWS